MDFHSSHFGRLRAHVNIHLSNGNEDVMAYVFKWTEFVIIFRVTLNNKMKMKFVYIDITLHQPTIIQCNMQRNVITLEHCLCSQEIQLIFFYDVHNMQRTIFLNTFHSERRYKTFNKWNGMNGWQQHFRIMNICRSAHLNCTSFAHNLNTISIFSFSINFLFLIIKKIDMRAGINCIAFIISMPYTFRSYSFFLSMYTI